MPKAVCVRRADAQPFAFGDLQIWSYDPGHEASSSVALVQVKPGVSHGRARSSRSDKYCYVLSGLIEFEVGRITYWLAQGDLLIVPKGEWYDYRNAGPEAASLLLVQTPSFRLDAEQFAGEG